MRNIAIAHEADDDRRRADHIETGEPGDGRLHRRSQEFPVSRALPGAIRSGVRVHRILRIGALPEGLGGLPFEDMAGVQEAALRVV
ncbi:hypothetical protein, partial [Burkholderia cenocepacia]|uniref:hypothetical protein n=1 Tax=Burkholderia cenocepacia TaxID=95486 RepID=UPI00222F443A